MDMWENVLRVLKVYTVSGKERQKEMAGVL